MGFRSCKWLYYYDGKLLLLLHHHIASIAKDVLDELGCSTLEVLSHDFSIEKKKLKRRRSCNFTREVPSILGKAAGAYHGDNMRLCMNSNTHFAGYILRVHFDAFLNGLALEHPAREQKVFPFCDYVDLRIAS